MKVQLRGLIEALRTVYAVIASSTFFIGELLKVAIDLVGRRIDDAGLRCMRTQRLKHVQSAQCIDFKVHARVSNGGGHGHLPRQMKHHGGAEVLHRARHIVGIAHIAMHMTEVALRAQPRQVTGRALAIEIVEHAQV